MCGNGGHSNRVDFRAHIARRGRTLPDQRKTKAKTTNRPSRTLRSFISPSFGRLSRISPVCSLMFAHLRRHALQRAEIGKCAFRLQTRWNARNHGVHPDDESATNRPLDCGAIADRSRTPTPPEASREDRFEARLICGLRVIGMFGEERRLGPGEPRDGSGESGRVDVAAVDQRQQFGDIGDWSRPATDGADRGNPRSGQVRHCRPRESRAIRSGHASRVSTRRPPECCPADRRDRVRGHSERAGPPRCPA